MRYRIVAMLFLVSGCVTQTLETVSGFDPAEAEFINSVGSNEIIGQAFLRRNDGVVVYAAGSDVSLIPKTRYSTERIRLIYEGEKYINIYAASAKKFKDTDGRYGNFQKTTKANGEGRFVFSQLADGEYYITTGVTWVIGDVVQGGALIDSIKVVGGQKIELILSGG